MKQALMLVMVLMGAAWALGCEQALFPEQAPRTQYEWYDRQRGIYTPREDTGPYGDPVPALRERLRPHD